MQAVIEHERCSTSKISQQQNQSQNRPVQNANTSHAAEACRLRAARRAGYASEDAPGARRKTHWLRAGRRAVCAPHERAACAPQDAPLARRKTRRLRAAKRAGCAPQDAPVARRKTRGLHAGRRAACMPEDVPLARRKTCRERAVCAPNARRVRASGAGRPVWPFSSRSSLPDFRGRAAGGRRHARRGPQVRRASPAHLRALARLEPKPGRREVPPGFAVRFRRQKESEAKHTKKTRRFKSQARACAVESS